MGDDAGQEPTALDWIASLLSLAFLTLIVVGFFILLHNLVRDPVGMVTGSWSGFWRGWSDGFHGAGRWVSVLTWFALGALGAAAIGGGIALLLSMLRARPATVFISYHHSRLNEVARLVEALETAGLVPLHIPFRSRAKRDELLVEISRAFRGANFVLCVPGSKPSFVDHEMFGAIVQNKRVILLIDDASAGAPNTALRAYPAMDLASVLATPSDLTRFLDFLWGGPRATLRLLTSGAPPPALVWRFLGYGVGGLYIAALLFNFILRISVLFGAPYDVAHKIGAAAAASAIWLGLGILGALVSIVALSPLSALLYRAVTQRILDRRTKAGNYSYPFFRRHLSACGLMDIQRAFLKKPPSAWYQLGQAEARRLSTDEGTTQIRDMTTPTDTA